MVVWKKSLRKPEQNLGKPPEGLQPLDSASALTAFQLGDWRVDVNGGELRNGGQITRLEPRLMQILVLLATASGQVVSRGEIFDTVWPNQEVSDQTLDSALSRLRSRLGDDSRSPTYIQTVPKKGYRLLLQSHSVPVAEAHSLQKTIHEKTIHEKTVHERTIPEKTILSEQDRSPRPVSSKNRRLALAAVVVISGLVLAVLSITPSQNTLLLPTLDPPTQPYLAVLPFAGLNDHRQGIVLADEGYGDAFATVLLEQIARVPGLQVASRSSAFRFSSTLLTTPIEVQRTAQLLGVDYLLGGQVERQGDSLRVKIQLAEGRQGEVVWTQSFSKDANDLGDALNIHSMVIASLAQTLLPGSAGLQAEVALDRPRSAATYDLYLLGRHYWHQRRPEALAEAEHLLREALAREPDFALAQAGLANTYLTMIEYGGLAKQDALALTQAPMAQAMQLAPQLAETHVVLGRWHLERFEWAEAEAALKRAIALNSNLSMAQMYLGNVYNDSGRIDLAYASYRQALLLDPLHATVLMNLSQSALKLGLHDRARSYLERAKSLFPQHTFLLGLSAHQLQAAGDQIAAQELVDQWEQARSTDARLTEPIDWLACNMLQSFVDRPQRALRCLDAIDYSFSERGLLPLEHLMVLSYRARLLELTGQPLPQKLRGELAAQIALLDAPELDDPTVLYEIAVAQAALGRTERAVDSFLRAQRRGARDVGWMYHDPRLDPLRDQAPVRDALTALGADQTRRGNQVLARFPTAGVTGSVVSSGTQ